VSDESPTDRPAGDVDEATADDPAVEADADANADADAPDDADPEADTIAGADPQPQDGDAGDDWGGAAEGTDLSGLREEIRSIDREIVELIARRTYVADTIASVKERRGLPTVDEHQEQRVMDRAGENAARFDVDRNLVKAVFRMLIELNKIEQRSRRRSTGTDDPLSVGDDDTSGRNPADE
jgi:chorismate mutase